MPEFEWQFTLVLLTNGVMIGLMYALIALGFVLIYKATDAINFAQGEFVMFAGFLAAGAIDIGGAHQVELSTEITYEDGRKATLNSTIVIDDVEKTRQPAREPAYA